MFSSSLAPFMFFLVPTAFALGVVMLVSAVFQDNKQFGWAVSMKHAFRAVISFLAVLVLSASIVMLGYLSLQRWVFTDSLYETSVYFYGSVPPGLFYFDQQIGADVPTTCAQDATECPLTDAHKEQIRVWKEQYEDWKTMGNTYFQNAKNFASALSVFAVSLPLFVVSFFFLRKLQSRLNSKSVIKDIYYYGLSFIALAVVVGASGVLLNIGFKGILLSDEDATRFKGGFFPGYPPLESRPETKSIEQLASCVSICGLPEEYGVLAREWQEDMEKVKDREKVFNLNHDEYAAMIPLIIVGSILFAYHFLIIRRNGRSGVLSTGRGEVFGKDT